MTAAHLPYNFIEHDGGRSMSKRPGQSRDCAVRSVAIAFDTPYDNVYEDFANLGRKCGGGTPKKVWQAYLDIRGAKRISFPAKPGKRRMNPTAFSAIFTKGAYVLQMAQHLTACVDGIIYDTIPVREGGCIYAVWEAQKNDHP